MNDVGGFETTIREFLASGEARDAERLRALLLDCPASARRQQRGVVPALVAAFAEGIDTTPRSGWTEISKQIAETHAFGEPRASEAMQIWAVALGNGPGESSVSVTSDSVDTEPHSARQPNQPTAPKPEPGSEVVPHVVDPFVLAVNRSLAPADAKQLLAAVTAGTISLSEAIASPLLHRHLVTTVLKATPGIAQAEAHDIVQRAEINPRTTAGKLSDNQRSELVNEYDQTVDHPLTLTRLRKRDHTLQALERGDMTLEDAFASGTIDDHPVRDVLQARRGVGPATADTTLQRAGINKTATVQSLTSAERRYLANGFGLGDDAVPLEPSRNFAKAHPIEIAAFSTWCVAAMLVLAAVIMFLAEAGSANMLTSVFGAGIVLGFVAWLLNDFT